jgi:hypothetical protein
MGGHTLPFGLAVLLRFFLYVLYILTHKPAYIVFLRRRQVPNHSQQALPSAEGGARPTCFFPPDRARWSITVCIRWVPNIYPFEDRVPVPSLTLAAPQWKEALISHNFIREFVLVPAYLLPIQPTWQKTRSWHIIAQHFTFARVDGGFTRIPVASILLHLPADTNLAGQSLASVAILARRTAEAPFSNWASLVRQRG